MQRATTVHSLTLAALIACAPAAPQDPAPARPYGVVDTGQTLCYGGGTAIDPPAPGQPYFGQDAQYHGPQPAYRDNGDGTVTDLNTGLMWQKTPDLENKATYPQAVEGASRFRLAGHDDWRLPSIKELYSLIQFVGSSQRQIPYLDTRLFDFRFGDPQRGERPIDSQFWSSTEYVGTIFGRQQGVFGVNFADGRIKGYPGDRTPRGLMTQFVRYVRGNPAYGRNDFVDNGDGTVTDRATGLMWQQTDDGATRSWADALAYAEALELAGHDDWRLPNAKELQSIVDYTRAPDARDASRRGPAIDPVFTCTEPESWFWTGTTLHDGPFPEGVYVCFGQAWGNMHGEWLNVHGAGAQRSDPTTGDPRRFARGRGPQGDQVRMANFVRCVRDAE